MNSDSYSYSNRKYDIVPYDPNWVSMYDELQAKIKSVFKSAQIEHIGSTSIPGMWGKASIDILVIIKDFNDLDIHVQEMEKLGFEYSGEFVMKESRLFRIMKDGLVVANVHLFPAGHFHIKEMLDLRNYLRTHPEEVADYSRIKQELHAKYPDEYASYRKEKDDYMNKLKEKVSRA